LSSELPEPDARRCACVCWRDSSRSASRRAVGLIQNSCRIAAQPFYGRNEPRAALCLSWLEVRRGRPLRRHAIEPARALQAEGPAVTILCGRGDSSGRTGPRPTPRRCRSSRPRCSPTTAPGTSDCNWMQARGDIDTGHTVYLHLGGVEPPSAAGQLAGTRSPTARRGTSDRHDSAHVRRVSPGGGDTNYWRIANFLSLLRDDPTVCSGSRSACGWVPMTMRHAAS